MVVRTDDCPSSDPKGVTDTVTEKNHRRVRIVNPVRFKS